MQAGCNLLYTLLLPGSTIPGPCSSLLACRQVIMVGQADASILQQNSSQSTASPAIASSAAQPSFSWTINDNTDLLQLGYGGSLTLHTLTLYLPEPCCVMVSLIGSWFFSNQPLPWSIFGTILPGAFSVQAVKVPQLNAPAHLIMRNVSIVYAACGTDFAAAAQLLVSKATADTEDLSSSLSFDAGNNTLYCQTCVFQGSQQVPSVYSNAVSTVSLFDTRIACLPPGSGTVSASSGASTSNATASGQSSKSISAQTSAAGWAPPVWLPILLAVGCCAMVALGVVAVWHFIRKHGHRSAFTSLHETVNVRMSSQGSKAMSPSANRVRSAIQLATDALRPSPPCTAT